MLSLLPFRVTQTPLWFSSCQQSTPLPAFLSCLLPSSTSSTRAEVVSLDHWAPSAWQSAACLRVPPRICPDVTLPGIPLLLYFLLFASRIKRVTLNCDPFVQPSPWPCGFRPIWGARWPSPSPTPRWATQSHVTHVISLLYLVLTASFFLPKTFSPSFKTLPLDFLQPPRPSRSWSFLTITLNVGESWALRFW